MFYVHSSLCFALSFTPSLAHRCYCILLLLLEFPFLLSGVNSLWEGLWMVKFLLSVNLETFGCKQKIPIQMVLKIKELHYLTNKFWDRAAAHTEISYKGKGLIIPLCHPVPFYSALGLTPVLALAATIPGITGKRDNVQGKRTLPCPLDLLKGKETFHINPPTSLLLTCNWPGLSH